MFLLGIRDLPYECPALVDECPHLRLQRSQPFACPPSQDRQHVRFPLECSTQFGREGIFGLVGSLQLGDMLVQRLDIGACRVERAGELIRFGSGLFIGTLADTTGGGQDGSKKQASRHPRRDVRG